MNWGGEILELDTPVAVAAERVFDAVDILLNNSLDPISDDGVVELMRDWEVARRKMAAFEHKLVREAENRNLPDKAGVKTTAKFLAQTLRLGHGEACARARAAEVLGLRQEAGQALEPVLPWTATYQAMGLVSVDSARRIAKIMDRVPGKVDPELRELAEFQLASFAA
ncbi:DUF222 domain-containing protein, partial [Nocardia tengchongensis]